MFSVLDLCFDLVHLLLHGHLDDLLEEAGILDDRGGGPGPRDHVSLLL